MKRSVFRSLFISIVFCLFPLMAVAGTFEGRVVRVIDGDTLDVMLSGPQVQRIRLANIDAPELHGQPFGQKSKEKLLDLAAGKFVSVVERGKDRYGRLIAEIYDSGGINLNREMVRSGLAWNYVRYSTDSALPSLEAAARQKRVGLWRDSDPVPPWAWRKNH